MRNTHVRLRYAGSWLLLVIGTSLSTAAYAGQGVWTSGGPSQSGYVGALAVNPATPSTLYAGAVDAIFKSTDSGGTWAILAPTSGFYVYYSALAINPKSPSTLYAGHLTGNLNPVGLLKSTDSGDTWAAAITGLPNPSVRFWTSVRALAINPATPSTLYAAGPGGVFRSTDSAGTWAPASTGLTITNVTALAIDPATPSTLYAAGPGAVFRSTDSGGTWAATGLTNGFVPVLAINPADPATLYIGTSGGGVFKTTDSGRTWATANTGLANLSVLSLAINPANTATLYAATYGGGVFRSTDAGGTWAAINEGLPDMDVYSLAVDPAGGTTLYAGLSNGVWQLSLPPSGASATFLLPTSAHTGGANGAVYTTNVSVANTGAAPLSFTMKFLGHDQDGSNGPEQTFNLDAGKSVTYFDVLGSVFGETSNHGAIRITSSTPSLNIVAVTSTPGSGGTMSQTIPAVLSSNLVPAGSSHSILYIREGDGFRTNLVLASGAIVPTNVDVSLVSPAGVSLATKTYPVPPNGMTQIYRVVRDMGVSGAITGARLVLSSSTPGAAFTGIASVIDETTNDPTTVEAR